MEGKETVGKKTADLHEFGNIEPCANGRFVFYLVRIEMIWSGDDPSGIVKVPALSLVSLPEDANWFKNALVSEMIP